MSYLHPFIAFQNQWTNNQGRCGVCGDPYQGPRENEAGGKYANGIIVRHYTESQTIDAVIGMCLIVIDIPLSVLSIHVLVICMPLIVIGISLIVFRMPELLIVGIYLLLVCL